MTANRTYQLYIGTYTAGDADSIYLYSMDESTGELEFVSGQKAGSNPSYLTFSPDGRHMFAVNQLSMVPGYVSAFEIEPATGRLTFLNQQESYGIGPCHLTTDRQGKFLLVANYRSGSLSVHPINPDGRLGPVSDVLQHQGPLGPAPEQEGPHAHFITVTADNRFALCCDLGLDCVIIYSLDTIHGKLLKNSETSLPPAAGPRHLDFHPSGNYVYLINELNSSLTVYSYNPDKGTISELQTLSTLPEGYTEINSCAEIWAHPSGQFVYGSNRGHDSIAIFSVEEQTGKLKLIGHESTRGKTPRYFTLDPAGKYLLAANQNSDSVVSFKIDEQTGLLTFLQKIEIPKPVCIKFRNANQSLNLN